jgi:uncharacterized protein
MQCPICNVELKMADRQGVEIDYCPKCRGVWLDRGELDKLIERSAQAEGFSMPVTSRRDNREDLLPDYDDDFAYKRKNDDRYRGNEPSYAEERRKKSFLGEMFDLFD